LVEAVAAPQGHTAATSTRERRAEGWFQGRPPDSRTELDQAQGRPLSADMMRY